MRCDQQCMEKSNALIFASLAILCGASVVAAVQRSPCTSPVTVAVWLAPGADPEAVAERNGFALVGRVSSLRDVYEFEIDCADRFDGDHDAAVEAVKHEREERLRDNPPDADILKESIQKKKLQHPRALATASAEGYVPGQWHLKDEPDNAASAHVLGAWRRGYFGSGAKIVVVDDGLDVAHADITRTVDRALSINYNSGVTNDPSPRHDEAHGTGASGVAAASGARSPPGAPQCGHGVAPLAGVVGARLIAEPATEANEARALTRGADFGDVGVYSCSWGPADDGATLDGPGDLTREAIEHGARTGRGGLGCLYSWAAGNGYANGDSCAYDGYASNPFTIAVTAVTHAGRAAWYSEACPAAFVCAPSSGDGRSIMTADISGYRGYAYGNCNTAFGGTSAAAPFVSGVLALMLGANPRLAARDAMRILAGTARRIDAADASWQQNMAGVWHSARYGFGVVDADAAVQAAVALTSATPLREWRSDAGVGRQQLTITDASPVAVVEGVVVTVTANHHRRGDLRFVLTHSSEDGQRSSSSDFENRATDGGRDFVQWPFYTVAHWGENPRGTWTLAVTDASDGDAPVPQALRSWSIHFYGK